MGATTLLVDFWGRVAAPAESDPVAAGYQTLTVDMPGRDGAALVAKIRSGKAGDGIARPINESGVTYGSLAQGYDAAATACKVNGDAAGAAHYAACAKRIREIPGILSGIGAMRDSGTKTERSRVMTRADVVDLYRALGNRWAERLTLIGNDLEFDMPADADTLFDLPEDPNPVHRSGRVSPAAVRKTARPARFDAAAVKRLSAKLPAVHLVDYSAGAGTYAVDPAHLVDMVSYRAELNGRRRTPIGVNLTPTHSGAIAAVPAAPAPAVDQVAPHAYVKGASGGRRCLAPGCDRGQTAKVHRVAPAPAVDQVAPAPVTVHMPAVDTAPAVSVSLTVADSVREAVAPAVPRYVAQCKITGFSAHSRRPGECRHCKSPRDAAHHTMPAPAVDQVATVPAAVSEPAAPAVRRSNRMGTPFVRTDVPAVVSEPAAPAPAAGTDVPAVASPAHSVDQVAPAPGKPRDFDHAVTLASAVILSDRVARYNAELLTATRYGRESATYRAAVVRCDRAMSDLRAVADFDAVAGAVAARGGIYAVAGQRAVIDHADTAPFVATLAPSRYPDSFTVRTPMGDSVMVPADHVYPIASVRVAGAVDQVATVPAAVSEPAAPATVDQVDAPAPAGDQVAPHVRDIIARSSWSVVNVGNRRAPHFVPLMKLPAGKLDRDDYLAVRDALAGIARSRWSKAHKGFTFEAGTDANPWREAIPSGSEVVRAWLDATATAPAGDQVATVPATVDQVDAPAPAACVAKEGDTVRFIGRRQLWTVADVMDGGARYLVEMMSGNAKREGAHYRSREVDATALEFVRTGNAENDRLESFLAEVDARKTPAVITPDLFVPYAGEIRGCRCQLCGAVASAARAGGDQVDAPARALLSALIDGRHVRTNVAPAAVSEPAAPAPVDQVATVPAAVSARTVDQVAPAAPIVLGPATLTEAEARGGERARVWVKDPAAARAMIVEAPADGRTGHVWCRSDLYAARGLSAVTWCGEIGPDLPADHVGYAFEQGSALVAVDASGPVRHTLGAAITCEVCSHRRTCNGDGADGGDCAECAAGYQRRRAAVDAAATVSPATATGIVAQRYAAIALAGKSLKDGSYVVNHRGGVTRIVTVKRMHGVDGFNIEGDPGKLPHWASKSGLDAAVIGANVCDKAQGECFCGMAHTTAGVLARLPLMTTEAVPALGHDDGAVTDGGMVKWQGWTLPAVAVTQASALAALADELGFAWRVLGVPAGAGTDMNGEWTTTDSVSLEIATPAKYDKGPKAEHHVIAWDSWTLVVRNGTGAALLTLDQVRAYLVAYAERLTSGKYRVDGDAMDACYRAATGRPMYGNPLQREAFTVDAPAAVSEPAAPTTVDQVATAPAVVPAPTVDQGPTVHTFGDTGRAYDRVQCDDTVRDGDILHVPSERVIGIASSAWPMAVTAVRGVLHRYGSLKLDELTSPDNYAGSISAARELAESLGYALAGDQVDAPAVDQVDTAPAIEPARIVVDTAPAPAVAPALAEDSAESAPAGATYGAHAQRVHVSNVGDGDGYRFHLVAGANARTLVKPVKAALARMFNQTGAQFYVTTPRKSGTVNVVPQPGHTVRDWAPALALFAEMLGEHIVPATECGACDRSAALVDA